MIVTKENYPSLFGALVDLEYYNGGGAFGRCFTEFDIPDKYDFALCEEALKTLNEDDMLVFIDGEESEMMVIADRSPGLQATWLLLNDYFMDMGDDDV